MYINEYELAYNIASKAHKGQKDKGGEDYFKHPLTVSNKLSGEKDKIVALLHDVIEDTDVTVNDLREAGFSDEVVLAVSVITKKDGEDYEEYLNRVKQNPIALRVKIADMEHNSDISRIKNPTEKDLKRLEKYRIRLKELRETLETGK
jgi:metal dependent phosphohydrolase